MFKIHEHRLSKKTKCPCCQKRIHNANLDLHVQMCKRVWPQITTMFHLFKDFRYTCNRVGTMFGIQQHTAVKMLKWYCKINGYSFDELDSKTEHKKKPPYRMPPKINREACVDCGFVFGNYCPLNKETMEPTLLVREGSLRKGRLKKGPSGYVCQECARMREGIKPTMLREPIYYHSPKLGDI